MHDIRNVMRGHQTVGGTSLSHGEQAMAYKGLYPFDSIMKIEVDNIWSPAIQITGQPGFVPALRMTVMPQDVLYGHPQFSNRAYTATFLLDENGHTKIDQLEIGETYLVRAVRQNAAGVNPPGSLLRDGSGIDFFPLFDDVYFINVNDENAVAHAMEIMADNIAILNENTHMLMLTGTRDMTAMPFVQSGMYQRFQGRFITEEDYLNANPVIVVPQNMESRRLNARVGETITLTLRDMRTFTDGATITPELQQRSEEMNVLVQGLFAGTSSELRMETFWWALPDGVEAHWRNFPAGYWVSIPNSYPGDWQSYPTVEIEVEVIGTYRFPDAWYHVPRWHHISISYRDIEAFVPASIIPEGWGIVDAHMVSGQYSFLLRSPGDDIAFMAAYGSRLEELGFTVQFLGEDPTNFLLSSEPIRNAITINLLLLTAVIGLVLALTVFLYLRQRHKEFAIMRALGMSGNNATWLVIVPVLAFWTPAVIGASVGGWFFALQQASQSLQTLAEVGLPTDYGETVIIRNFLDQLRYDAALLDARATAELSLRYLLLLCTGLVLVWVTTVLGGTILFASKSMISLIQSASGGGAPMKNAKLTEAITSVKLTNIMQALSLRAPTTTVGKAKSSLRHHGRHIFRAPVKYLLVVATALLFIVALGWLDNTIEFTEQEIERLYATTTITGEVISLGTGIDSVLRGHEIPPESLEIIANSPYVANYNTAAHTRMGLFATIHYYNEEMESYRITQGMLNIVKTICDLDTFVQNANRPVIFGQGLGSEFSLNFAPGFGYEHFRYTQGQPIPIIVHESLLHRNFTLHANSTTAYYAPRTLQLGDNVYLLSGHVIAAGMGGWAYDSVYHAIIIGVYSGGHPATTYSMGQGLVLVPDIRWSHFSTVTFTVAQEKLRYMRQFEEEMDEQLHITITHNVYQAGEVIHSFQEQFRHSVLLNDAEFRVVIVPLEENLNLLRILYPIAKVMSFALALGLGLLLMLQNTKIVAILRALGSPRHKTRVNLCLEQLIVCAVGVVVGAAIVLIMGVSVGTLWLLIVPYFGGSVIGTVLGIIVISRKTPIELLQVRE